MKTKKSGYSKDSKHLLPITWVEISSRFGPCFPRLPRVTRAPWGGHGHCLLGPSHEVGGTPRATRALYPCTVPSILVHCTRTPVHCTQCTHALYSRHEASVTMGWSVIAAHLAGVERGQVTNSNRFVLSHVSLSKVLISWL